MASLKMLAAVLCEVESTVVRVCWSNDVGET
jgi:hypothetical protein